MSEKTKDLLFVILNGTLSFLLMGFLLGSINHIIRIQFGLSIDAILLVLSIFIGKRIAGSYLVYRKVYSYLGVLFYLLGFHLFRLCDLMLYFEFNNLRSLLSFNIQRNIFRGLYFFIQSGMLNTINAFILDAILILGSILAFKASKKG